MKWSILIVLAVSTPALADDLDKDLDSLFAAGGLTAEGAAARGAGASPTVQRRAAEVQAATAQREQAQLAQVPVVRGELSAARLSSIPTFDIPVAGKTFAIAFPTHEYAARATLVVPLSDYLVRFPAAIDAARLSERAARIGEEASANDASEDARLAYYEWVRAQLQVLISRRQLAQVQTTLDQVRSLVEVQKLPRADQLRVESLQAQAEQTVDQLTELAALREEQLRILIGAAANEHLMIGEDVRSEVLSPNAGTLDALTVHADTRRLDLRSIDAGIRAKDQQRVAEQRNAYPRLNGSATLEDANPNSRYFPPADTFKLTWTAGLSLSWQLSDYLDSETSVKRIAAETDELRADRDNIRRKARIEILAAQQAVSIARHALATTQKGLLSAEEGYRVREELLAADRATAVEIVDAQTELTRARISALDARIDLRIALAQLRHALGDDAR